MCVCVWAGVGGGGGGEGSVWLSGVSVCRDCIDAISGQKTFSRAKKMDCSERQLVGPFSPQR